MTAAALVLALAAGAIVGTPRGEALRWARGRHWFGRLVVTSPYRLCNGQRLHLWASGKPPLAVEHVRIEAPWRDATLPRRPGEEVNVRLASQGPSQPTTRPAGRSLHHAPAL